MMSLLTQIPAVAEKLGEGLSGLAINYRHSPIIEEHAAGRAGPAAGDRAPDAPLVAAKGQASLRLYNLFAEHRHILLLLGNGPEALPPTMPRFPDSVFAVYRIVPPGTSGGDYVDCESVVAKRYGSTPIAYLIRPDGYVGFRCDQRTLSENLSHYLAKLFSPAGSG
jgi:hypothetical protein